MMILLQQHHRNNKKLVRQKVFAWLTLLMTRSQMLCRDVGAICQQNSDVSQDAPKLVPDSPN